MGIRCLLVVSVVFASLVFAQKPEYDFYADYRAFASTQYAKNRGVALGQVVEAYVAKLKSEGVPEGEIARRKSLLTTAREKLDADRWNRFYQDSNALYNREPNGFLMEVVADRTPGVALDYGMGTGRNALYLAKLGWKVYGFDLSEARSRWRRSGRGSLDWR